MGRVRAAHGEVSVRVVMSLVVLTPHVWGSESTFLNVVSADAVSSVLHFRVQNEPPVNAGSGAEPGTGRI